MKKDFDAWNEVKKQVHDRNYTPYFHEREVWWCQLGKNVGHEQNGKGQQFLRPVLVVKKLGRTVCICIPITTRIKRGRFYFSFLLNKTPNNVVLSQIRLVDARRFRYKLGKISREDFDAIKEKLTRLFV